MVKLPQQLTLPQMMTKWAAIINPVITNPICNGIQLTGIKLLTGDNSINHKLGRKPNGYIVTSVDAGSTDIYRKVSQLPELTIILTSAANATIDLYVY